METSVLTGSSPLPLLLWGALGGIDRAHGDQGAGAEGMPSLSQWANLLRALKDEGNDSRELPTLLRLSTRAVRSEIASAVRRGWAQEVKFGRGKTAVRRTAVGMDVAARWKLLRDSAEKVWQRRIGVGASRKLRASLEDVVARLPLEHPHYPAGYGMADARIAGGNGQDWKAVPRGEGDTVSTLPISALVSQASVAFAFAYEEKSEVALSWSATVITQLPPEGRTAKELCASPVALSALERHGFLRLEDDANGPILCLTAKGRGIKDAHDHRVYAVEQAWRKLFGDDAVARLRSSLENVADTAASATRCGRC